MVSYAAGDDRNDFTSCQVEKNGKKILRDTEKNIGRNIISCQVKNQSASLHYPAYNVQSQKCGHEITGRTCGSSSLLRNFPPAPLRRRSAKAYIWQTG
jgi:hypothetical protein